MKDCLVLLTKTYPFDKGEEFIENEVPILAQSFHQVILIATSTGDKPVQTRKTADNVRVFSVPASKIRKGLPSTAVKYFPFSGFKGLCDAQEKTLLGHSLKKRLFLTYFLAKADLVCREATELLQSCNLEQYDRVTFYSYWFYDTAVAAIRLKEQCAAAVKRVVSRAHGYDLYPYRNPMNYLPMRGYILQHIDALYPCSENGSSFLKERYPEYSDKIHTAYLGTKDFGVSTSKEETAFHIVSCCHIVPVKRVELLAQALACLKDSGLKLEWTHFGGGEGLNRLKEYADSALSFMKCEFSGEIQNEKLMEYYQKNSVDLFVNTSSSEGLPVSIMEACSFGIPALATNVGGTGEIVQNGITGFLVSADVTAEELAKKIKEAVLLPKEQMQQLRENCREEWQKKFCAQDNFRRFAEEIKAK
ncbi:MAG: glycosyltransferase [Ruminococcaceae bacterium]|nr:glycosyltransferase [Oscillospiraceae bacterium]HHV32036.1 glycosyltransferase [Clostridiales bacterium]